MIMPQVNPDLVPLRDLLRKWRAASADPALAFRSHDTIEEHRSKGAKIAMLRNCADELAELLDGMDPSLLQWEGYPDV